MKKIFSFVFLFVFLISALVPAGTVSAQTELPYSQLSFSLTVPNVVPGNNPYTAIVEVRNDGDTVIDPLDLEVRIPWSSTGGSFRLLSFSGSTDNHLSEKGAYTFLWHTAPLPGGVVKFEFDALSGLGIGDFVLVEISNPTTKQILYTGYITKEYPTGEIMSYRWYDDGTGKVYEGDLAALDIRIHSPQEIQYTIGSVISNCSGLNLLTGAITPIGKDVQNLSSFDVSGPFDYDEDGVAKCDLSVTFYPTNTPALPVTLTGYFFVYQKKDPVIPFTVLPSTPSSVVYGLQEFQWKLLFSNPNDFSTDYTADIVVPTASVYASKVAYPHGSNLMTEKTEENTVYHFSFTFAAHEEVILYFTSQSGRTEGEQPLFYVYDTTNGVYNYVTEGWVNLTQGTGKVSGTMSVPKQMKSGTTFPAYFELTSPILADFYIGRVTSSGNCRITQLMSNMPIFDQRTLVRARVMYQVSVKNWPRGAKSLKCNLFGSFSVGGTTYPLRTTLIVTK